MGLIKKVFLFIFGLLAILIGSVIFAWILYNLTTDVPIKEFARSVGTNIFYKIFRIISGLSMCFVMVAVGYMWIRKSRVHKIFRKKRNLD